MYRNLLIILILAAGLTFLLIERPWEADDIPDPLLVDRLPDADIIGMSNLLELSAALSSTLYYYKIPFRDLISPDFILSQGKNYGIDVQSPVYVFMNENNGVPEDWGVLASIKDSSKVREGIVQVQKFMDLEIHEANGNTYYIAPTYNAHAIYGKDWMMIYQGNNFNDLFTQVLSAKNGSVKLRWKEFIAAYKDNAQSLILDLNVDWLKENGIKNANVLLKNDSTSFIINTILDTQEPVDFKIKKKGPTFYPQEFTKHMMSLHIEPDGLADKSNNILHRLLAKHTKKVAFPVSSFLKAWNGDVAFRQGGYEYIREKYIESELDENFNITEVTKFRNVKVSGFSLYLSMNENIDGFISAISKKGILTKDENKYRLLYSPPLNMHKTDSSLTLYTNRYTPNMYMDSTNNAHWQFERTPFEFYLDSTDVNSIFGRIIFPLDNLVKQLEVIE